MKINSYLNKIGIFTTSLVATFAAVYFFSPTISTNAADSEADVNVDVAPVISMVLNTNELNFNINPTPEGTFDSKSLAVAVYTNSTGGYELYFSTNDNDNNMTSQTTSDVIPSRTNTITCPSPAVNTWGYIKNTSITSFDDVPTGIVQACYGGVPTIQMATQLKSTLRLPKEADRVTGITIGVKVDNAITAGVYNKKVTFTAIAHPSIEPSPSLHEITSMQEMTDGTCSMTTTPNVSATQFDWDGSHHGDKNYIPRKVLVDTRDNNTYLVSKLADGNCWMSQNLALDFTASNAVTVTTLTNGSTFTMTPNYSIQTTTGVDWTGSSSDWRGYHPQANESYYQGGITKSSAPSGNGHEYDWEKAGNYYGWMAAIGTTGSLTQVNYDGYSSLCPQGWRLPAHSGDKSYVNLLTTVYGLNSSTAPAVLRADPFNFILSGRYEIEGNMADQGQFGYYWTSRGMTYDQYSTSDDMEKAHNLTIGASQSSVLNTLDGQHKNYGHSIRCVNITPED